MTYIKQDWVGAVDPLVPDEGSTPISDDRLNYIEQGIFDAAEAADQANEAWIIVPRSAYDAMSTPRPDKLYFTTQ